jgi:hypothetical protein
MQAKAAFRLVQLTVQGQLSYNASPSLIKYITVSHDPHLSRPWDSEAFHRWSVYFNYSATDMGWAKSLLLFMFITFIPGTVHVH